MSIPAVVIGFVLGIVIFLVSEVIFVRYDDEDDEYSATSPPVHNYISTGVDLAMDDTPIEDVDVQESYCIIADKSYLEQPVGIATSSLPDSCSIRAEHQYRDEKYKCFYIAADIDEPIRLDQEEFERLMGVVR